MLWIYWKEWLVVVAIRHRLWTDISSHRAWQAKYDLTGPSDFGHPFAYLSTFPISSSLLQASIRSSRKTEYSIANASSLS